MENKTARIMQEFSLLSRTEKQKQVVALVKRGTKSAMPVLRMISSEDTDVQIRYLARKAMFHLKQRLSKDGEADGAPDFAKLKTLITGNNPEKAAKSIEICLRRHPNDLLIFLRKNQPRFNDPFVLSSIAIAIGRAGGPQDLEWIRILLEHGDSRVRASAVEALGCLGLKEGAPYLLKSLADPDNRIRANAIRALRLQDRNLVFDSLQEMAGSNEIWMRNSAAFAIGEYRSDEVLDLLAALLQDKVESVRKMAFKSLERLAEKGVVKANILKERLHELKESESITDFLTLVHEIGEERSDQDSSLHSEDPSIRLAEISRIVESNEPERFRELEERLMEEEDNYVCASLILALGRVRQESSAPLIRSFLNHPIPRIRANAIESLSKLGKREFLPEIILNLDDVNNRARANAIVALKDLPYVDIIKPLSQMASSTEPKDRHSAFFAITEVDTEEAYQLLLPLANSGGKDLQKNIRDFILMTETEKPFIRQLKEKLQSIIDFSAATEDFEEMVTGSEEPPSLSTEPSAILSEEDFEGFRPDTATTAEKIDSVNLEDFLQADAQKKLLMLDFLKKHQTQENFTILRYAEKDRDFQVKCIAKIALSAYKGLNFKLEEIRNVDVDLKGNVDVSSLYFIEKLSIERKQIQYEGHDSIAVLNQELQRRTIDFKHNGFWEGRFGVRNKLLCSLRMDTQEMLLSVIGDEQQSIRAIGLCYYSPTFKQYVEGSKSLDGIGYENYIQLNSEKARMIGEDLCDPLSQLIRTVQSPKYLLLLVTPTRLIIFLRHTLQYKKAETVTIMLNEIQSVRIEKDTHSHNLVVDLGQGIELYFPRLAAKTAELLLETLNEPPK
jgi:HEAT repeat protein